MNFFGRFAALASQVPGSVKRPLSMIQNCAARLLDMVSNIMDAPLGTQRAGPEVQGGDPYLALLS